MSAFRGKFFIRKKTGWARGIIPCLSFRAVCRLLLMMSQNLGHRGKTANLYKTEKKLW